MSGQTPPTDQPNEAGGPPPLRASHADRDRTVDMLRVAAGDGLLDAAELDQRLEVALTARTLDQLAGLTADLPPLTAADGPAVEAKDVVRIEQQAGSVRREGRWVVPRRMELQVSWCDVTLDFTDAVITRDTLDIEMNMRGGTLLLVTGPGVVVNTDSLSMNFSKGAVPAAGDPATPPRLRVELTGGFAYGRIKVRTPRRTFGQWLLRRPV
ncbi:DUF1707 SHOCT-like domain-containing protein [Streptomyces sp. SDr-06]|uniref:DUF1707 SHOCT-like domain-containing protein n=1 Tax=Streptomyces sp. SDr-06 TaxID=2267702 RepID=UPI000DE85C6C|nr:DUF1707 domain-containing protein [Streptomyces sp. SDr-06]RCH70152.1 DUF1707 domain-containing protein [Streptomyces sp. SDr-06]